MSILTLIIVGLIAGWLAGVVVRGTGFGILGDIIVGIIGAFIGGWIFSGLGAGYGIIGTIIVAAIGAIILVLIVGLFTGRTGYLRG
ncbi:MAG: GlsB/YeaQ/YmgE family stress response membrane protein [Candidatus Pacebacteria bacterium]|nr:GlsB/YeaQ/YmgE family stress response membrane protein [Candidatus Paceibacterota bacterium]MDR3582924.1 GlsB/YeaQ/YmgE family stress response membrane protein [Candidatus Paceibacterota bacterium]